MEPDKSDLVTDLRKTKELKQDPSYWRLQITEEEGRKPVNKEGES